MKTKTFDCVQMKHDAQERRQKEIEHMTEEERHAYYHRAHEELVRLQAELRKKTAAAA